MLPDLAALEAGIGGEVIRPGSPGYDQVRRPPITRFRDVRPQVIVRCRGPEDVAEAIAFAQRSGLELAVRSGGHCFAGRSSTEGLLIDTSPISSVLADGEFAASGAGARLADLYDALEPLGRTVAAGCGPGVGIAGLTLGGGLGILGRSYGLTCDQLVEAQVVLADGRVVDCDEHRHGDLFWALRGAGGGQFGVVTRLTLRTVPAPLATCFDLVWPLRDAAAVLAAWQGWSPGAPDEVAASLLLIATADPGQPPVASVFGALLGTESAAAERLDELIVRIGTDPSSATFSELPYRAAKRHLAERPPGSGHLDLPPGGDAWPGVSYSKSEFFAQPLPADTIPALVDHFAAERVPGQARELDFSPWAGAYNRVDPHATAFAHRRERFLLKHAVIVDLADGTDGSGAAHGAAADSSAASASPAGTRVGRDWLTRSWSLVHPYGSGGAYPNFPDPDLAGWEHAYHGGNYDRLVQVKARYDPRNVFRFHQSVRP